ncbi:DUF2516 family protein [Jatrophihabitans lederbergiae]|uniref:DUF2516 family protein n=1 Tax=Jatrophihabitans lederbergiae TaxID=3075547 RepID=A0ABU2JDW9_9ACTN|nr:DUF2516 family protein [Jatrophihabitans sp. DSM 44399]MDT0263185.1 DUF2516 family protein [Jatrophihabitans sp. DSM 44399]
MQTIYHIQDWLMFVLLLGVLALQVWALVDCVSRKAAAFPAAGKLTKPTWVLMTVLALIVVLLLRDVTNLVSYIAIIISSVYLADVRPAVREISGPSRW